VAEGRSTSAEAEIGASIKARIRRVMKMERGGGAFDRDAAWERLTGSGRDDPEPWDLLVVGGGITGAGILLEAARRGVRAALVEQRDFAWGSSSRSSKMAHGGLRYLMMGRVGLTRACAVERARMLEELPGLVDPLGFLFPGYRRRFPGRWSFMPLLALYNRLAGRRTEPFHPPHEFELLAPHVRGKGLKGGARCVEGITDDARLVLRVLREAGRSGALALNYAAATQPLWAGGRIRGAAVTDRASGRTGEVRARRVINATGPWVDQLMGGKGAPGVVRPLRGSHLVFPFWRLPVAQAVALFHPADRRGVFVTPWEGTTLVGNTDLDHREDLDREPRMTTEEVDYLLEALRFQFPALNVKAEHALSSFAGVRPVIGSGASLAPSKERRDHRIWEDRGLVSVSGGKLTTYRRVALEALQAAGLCGAGRPSGKTLEGRFAAATPPVSLERELGRLAARRLAGRYGVEVAALEGCAREGELAPVPGTLTPWVELRWSARTSGVVHLEDLLLRRTRLGIVSREGGTAFLDRVKGICMEELGWSEADWQRELTAYRRLWDTCYRVK
jgi:glycerol-3-phosphate dehydrogenase